MASLDFAFDGCEVENDFNNSFSYIQNDEPVLEIDESTVIKRRYITKKPLFSNDDIQIEYYQYDSNHLDYITNYIYPFWKLEFLNKYIANNSNDKKEGDYNPYSTWSNTELARHNMGLKDNTICFELKSADVTIGFCSILLLDRFDKEGFNSVFTDSIYDDSLVFYNYIIEKSFRGQGYGQIFIREIIKYIDTYVKNNNNKYKYIVLYVDKDNLAAKHIYQQNEFVYVCENPKNNQEEIFRYTIC